MVEWGVVAGMEGCMDEWIEGWVDRFGFRDRWGGGIGGRLGGGTGGGMDEVLGGRIDAGMGGEVDGRCMEGWTKGWVERWVEV